MNFDEERALAAVAHEAIVETRRRRRWQIFFRFIWMGYFLLLLLIMLNVGGNRDSASSGPTSEHIAVVPIQGLISADSDANADDIIRSLEKAFKNPNAKAVFLDINSGGGSPVQSGEIYRAVMRLKSEHKLPVYDVIADAGASGE